jgi:uncharacterized phage protein gp47/JayE
MATYSVTTTAREDRGLAFMLSRENADRAAAGQPPLDLAGFVDKVLRQAFRQYADQADSEDAASIATAFRNAAPAKQATIKAALGL